TGVLCKSGGKGVAGTILVVSLVVISAVLRAQATAVRVRGCASALSERAVSAFSFSVVGEASKTTYGFRSEAIACSNDTPIGNVWLRSEGRLTRGQHLRCIGSFERNEADEWGERARMQGVSGTVHVRRILNERQPSGLLGMVLNLRSIAVRAIDPTSSPSRALLAGCVCGWRDGLSDFGVDVLCSRCGISHLVAVSGSHLAIITSIVSAVLTKARRSPKQRVLVLVLFGGLYVVFCGAPVSAVRAWLMSSVSYAGMMCGRRAHGLSGVCLVGVAMALWDPAVSGQLGFLLSVISVVSLSIFSPYATVAIKELVGRPPRLPFIPRRMSRRIGKLMLGIEESLGASVVASVATMPLVAQTFGVFPLVGPLCNALLAVPFSAFVTLGMVTLALCGVPYVRQALLHVCDLLGSLVLGIGETMGNLPHAEISTASLSMWMGPAVVLTAMALLVIWPMPTRKRSLKCVGCIAFLCAALYVNGRYFAPARVCVLDVGQGDAVLVQDGAHALLVDAGPGDAVLDALARNNVWEVDAVLVTHLHADHYEGLFHMEGHCGCGRVLVACGVEDHIPSDLQNALLSLTREPPLELQYGDVLRVGRFSLRMRWPTEDVDGGENAESVELLIEYDDGVRSLTGLLTGDAETDELAAIIAKGDVGNIDFLKVGHHGSEVSITPAQACAIDPEVSVASAGEGNTYGHPSRECMDALEEAGSIFVCTKDVGDVEVLPGEHGPALRVANPDGWQ
ncbi:MAG: ComEC/Rec2 family competence protein, partial [Atopobiaceae bacterium]|nr:ComEC/Rec2 family competence protein [Atopobiaceae bacterium]